MSCLKVPSHRASAKGKGTVVEGPPTLQLNKPPKRPLPLWKRGNHGWNWTLSLHPYMIYMEVSINGGTPKWIVYSGNSYLNRFSPAIYGPHDHRNTTRRECVEEAHGLGPSRCRNPPGAVESQPETKSETSPGSTSGWSHGSHGTVKGQDVTHTGRC